MVKEQIVKNMNCKDCPYLLMGRKYTSVRYDCICAHPNRDYIQNYFEEHNIRKFLGFLCYSRPYVKEPTIKTSPKWCPLKVGDKNEHNV